MHPIKQGLILLHVYFSIYPIMLELQLLCPLQVLCLFDDKIYLFLNYYILRNCRWSDTFYYHAPPSFGHSFPCGGA